MMTPSAGSGRTCVLTLRVTVIVFVSPCSGMLCPILYDARFQHSEGSVDTVNYVCIYLFITATVPFQKIPIHSSRARRQTQAGPCSLRIVDTRVRTVLSVCRSRDLKITTQAQIIIFA